MSEHLLLGRPMWRVVLAATVQAVPLLGCGGGAQIASTSGAKSPPVQVASVTSETRATDATAPASTAATRPTPSTPVAVPVDVPVAAKPVPTECAPGVAPCAAPSKFVDQLCRGKYQDLALVMLAKGTPWRRAYVKVEKLDPVNIYDGERSDEWLKFGEEVLILRTRGPGSGGGVQVSGPTDIDVLRWDGTCATIRQELVAPYPTNTSIATPRIAWKYLASQTQEALLANALVSHLSDQERPACRGSNMKSPDAACDKASRKLTDAITVALRGGLALPEPSKVPSW
jgi:hypothetical protein